MASENGLVFSCRSFFVRRTRPAAKGTTPWSSRTCSPSRKSWSGFESRWRIWSEPVPDHTFGTVGGRQDDDRAGAPAAAGGPRLLRLVYDAEPEGRRSGGKGLLFPVAHGVRAAAGR